MAFLRRFACWLFGHDYRRIQRFSDGTERIGCPCCRREWGMHHGERTLVDWDFDLDFLYRKIFGETMKAPPWRQ